MYETMTTKTLVENYFWENGRINKEDMRKTQKLIKQELKNRFSAVLKQLDDPDNTTYGAMWTLLGEKPNEEDF